MFGSRKNIPFFGLKVGGQGSLGKAYAKLEGLVSSSTCSSSVSASSSLSSETGDDDSHYDSPFHAGAHTATSAVSRGQPSHPAVGFQEELGFHSSSSGTGTENVEVPDSPDMKGLMDKHLADVCESNITEEESDHDNGLSGDDFFGLSGESHSDEEEHDKHWQPSLLSQPILEERMHLNRVAPAGFFYGASGQLVPICELGSYDFRDCSDDSEFNFSGEEGEQYLDDYFEEMEGDFRDRASNSSSSSSSFEDGFEITTTYPTARCSTITEDGPVSTGGTAAPLEADCDQHGDGCPFGCPSPPPTRTVVFSPSSASPQSSLGDLQIVATHMEGSTGESIRVQKLEKEVAVLETLLLARMDGVQLRHQDLVKKVLGAVIILLLSLPPLTYLFLLAVDSMMSA